MTTTPQSYARGQVLSRTCPCCGTEFEPSSYSAVTCSPACSKRAYRLRKKHTAYVSGERNVTPKVLADAQCVLDADSVVKAEKVDILAQREADDAQRRAEREAERETQRARREVERALLVKASETLRANRRARKAAREVGEEGPETMAERDPIAIAAKEMTKEGYCTEVLAFAIMSARAYEQEPEEWQQKFPLWAPSVQALDTTPSFASGRHASSAMVR